MSFYGYQTVEVPTMADLQSRELLSYVLGQKQYTVTQFNLLGYYAPGDAGGNRRFTYDPTSAAAHNGGTVVQPAYGTQTPLTMGRLVQQNADPFYVDASWFGVVVGDVSKARVNGQACRAAFMALPASPVFAAGLVSPYAAGWDAAPPVSAQDPWSRIDLVGRAGTLVLPSGYIWTDRTLYTNAGVRVTSRGNQPYRHSGPLLRLNNAFIAAVDGNTLPIYRRARTLSAVKFNWALAELQAANSATNDNFFVHIQHIGINGAGEAGTGAGHGCGGIWLEAWAQGTITSDLDLSALESYIYYDGVGGGGGCSMERINILSVASAAQRSHAISMKNPNGVKFKEVSIVGHNGLNTTVDDAVAGDGVADPAGGILIYGGPAYGGISFENVFTEQCAKGGQISHDNGAGVASPSAVTNVDGNIICAAGTEQLVGIVTAATGNGVPPTLTVGSHQYVVGQKVDIAGMVGNTAPNGSQRAITAVGAIDPTTLLPTTLTIGALAGNGAWVSGGTVTASSYTNPYFRFQGNVGYKALDIKVLPGEGQNITPAYSNVGDSVIAKDTSYAASPATGGMPANEVWRYEYHRGADGTFAADVHTHSIRSVGAGSGRRHFWQPGLRQLYNPADLGTITAPSSALSIFQADGTDKVNAIQKTWEEYSVGRLIIIDPTKTVDLPLIPLMWGANQILARVKIEMDTQSRAGNGSEDAEWRVKLDAGNGAGTSAVTVRKKIADGDGIAPPVMTLTATVLAADGVTVVAPPTNFPAGGFLKLTFSSSVENITGVPLVTITPGQ